MDSGGMGTSSVRTSKGIDICLKVVRIEIQKSHPH